MHVANILIHREYTNAFPAKLIIERGQVRTENSNRPHGFGALNPENLTPFPKNPVIAGFFRQIGRADELGSGMRNMMKYGKVCGGKDPELIEGDVFRIIVRAPEAEEQVGKEGRAHINDEAHYRPTTPQVAQVTPQVAALLKTVGKSPKTREELTEKVGIADRKHFRKACLEPLRKAGLAELIEKAIPDNRPVAFKNTD